MGAYSTQAGGSGAAAFNPGGVGRIPFGDGTGTALTTASPLRYITANRRISDATFAYLVINDSTGTGIGYSSVAVSLDSADITLQAVQRTKCVARFETAKGADVATGTTVTFTDGNVFVMTGTTTLNHMTIANWQAGSTIRIKLSGNVTVTNNAGSPPGGTVPFQLAGAANFSGTANDWLTLTYDGTNVCETARSVN